MTVLSWLLVAILAPGNPWWGQLIIIVVIIGFRYTFGPSLLVGYLTKGKRMALLGPFSDKEETTITDPEPA